MISALYIGADMNVAYSGASIASTGAYLNAGTCTWTLKDSDGLTVGNGSLAYVAASNGNYLGVIESTVTGTLTADAPYTLYVVFAQSTYDDKRIIPLRAANRTAA